MTREFGATKVTEASGEANESDTVMRFLEGEAEIETRYGGGYVKSIDGLEESERGGHPYDWFFWVNGVDSPTGAAEVPLEGGEKIWWDIHNWSASEGVAGGGRLLAGAVHDRLGRARAGGRRRMRGRRGACGTATKALEREGVKVTSGGGAASKAAIRVLVGPWSKIQLRPGGGAGRQGPRRKRHLRRIRIVPGQRFGWSGSTKTAKKARTFGANAGLVAATRRFEGPPVWLVTGATDAGVQAAAASPRRRRPARPFRGGERSGHGDAAAPQLGVGMRSPFAYIPRRGPLQQARVGAAVSYLGALVVVAFLYSNPLVLVAAGLAACMAGWLAGARTAVRAALRMGLGLAFLIVVVNALVVDRGETVLARLGDWPLLGQVDITLEAIVAGVSIGLRAAVTMVAFAVYSACVDPDRVLRALRPVAARSALTASLVSRLVPVAAADAARLRDAAQLRGPGAAPVGRGPLARRLLAGSLDRAVDVAATLELRGYSLGGPRGARRREPSRYDARFYAVAAVVLVAAIVGKVRRCRRLPRLSDGSRSGPDPRRWRSARWCWRAAWRRCEFAETRG